MDSIKIKILIPLVAAHFLSDFVLQTDLDVKQKKKLKIFLKHISLVTSVSYLFLGLFYNYLIPVFILITHSLIDLIKLKVKKDNIWIFLSDQFLHIIILIFVSSNHTYFTDTSDQFSWEKYFGKDYYSVLLLITSSIIITKFSGILIGYLIKPLQSKIFKEAQSNNNLPQTGKIIGYLERFIILISVLMNVPAIIGFLITAKSILRYAEIKSENDKLFVEYILIGTLFSFALGISISYLANESITAMKVII
ncbi:Hypothetical protein IALB_1768 [Ignavibacterium album JCM 16511]|uniref:DUF3307 domain-containing protein n=1 Tax=Ignavibacterium album (strain DSM 19864 / JCM 16511 / NBRC 101810 / Mat9-16) TaxID=945713 RepID=I0AKG8_IGNAJ|nr:DUF3307 domain-containing protein [Ignavibacterium album]AFH49475.1 Hypothetical protein IALB_1768 [Ignavibacterium album JCM 16511]